MLHKFRANRAGLKAKRILRRLCAGVSRVKFWLPSYGLGKLKKASKNGSKSGPKMEVRGKVGGGRWWWVLEKVEIFRFFSVVAKCHEMIGNDVKRVWECVLGCGGCGL